MDDNRQINASIQPQCLVFVKKFFYHRIQWIIYYLEQA
jgi:hypothetical protein